MRIAGSYRAKYSNAHHVPIQLRKSLKTRNHRAIGSNFFLCERERERSKKHEGDNFFYVVTYSYHETFNFIFYIALLQHQKRGQTRPIRSQLKLPTNNSLLQN